MKGLAASFIASAREKRIHGLVDSWLASDQAQRVKATFGPIVLSACKWEVESIARKRNADERGAIMLTTAAVKVCEERAVTQARVAAHGPWALHTPDGGDRWKHECETVRASILKGIQPLRIGEPQDVAPANVEEILTRPPTLDQQRTMEAIRLARERQSHSPAARTSSEAREM